VLTPYQAPDGSIVWRCGAAAPLPMEPLGGVTLDGTDVQPKYLPGNCRATAQPGALVPPPGGPIAALF
jgi:hypothetical protein